MWYGHYRSSSAFKRHNMQCSFEVFLRKGGRNQRLWLASQNCYFLCWRDNFRDQNNVVRINTSFLHVLSKLLDFERKLLFSVLLTSDFFSGTLTCALRILIFSSKIMCNLFWISRRSYSARKMWNPPPLTCCCWGQQQVSRGFLFILVPMNSVLSVRYFVYDLLGIVKNLAQRVWLFADKGRRKKPRNYSKRRA